MSYPQIFCLSTKKNIEESQTRKLIFVPFQKLKHQLFILNKKEFNQKNSYHFII
jgi:hypothetical protein